MSEASADKGRLASRRTEGRARTHAEGNKDTRTHKRARTLMLMLMQRHTHTFVHTHARVSVSELCDRELTN